MIISELTTTNGVKVLIGNDSISPSGSVEDRFRIMVQRRAAYDVLVANKKEVESIGRDTAT